MVGRNVGRARSGFTATQPPPCALPVPLHTQNLSLTVDLNGGAGMFYQTYARVPSQSYTACST